MFIWDAFINDIAVSIQNSAAGGDFTKISTKLITFTVNVGVALEVNNDIERIRCEGCGDCRATETEK